jgi:hypothetical protein
VNRDRGFSVIAALVGAVLLTTLRAPAASAGLLVTANDDAYSAAHDRVLSVASPGLLANDSGVGLTAAKLTNPAHGSVTVNTDGSFTYQPSAGYLGPDSFTYEARVLSLGFLVTDSATVTLTVTNTAPVAVDDSYVGVTGVTLSVPAPGVLANDTDRENDRLTASLVAGGGNGSLTLRLDGSFSFKSGGSFTGLRTFTYQAFDGIAWSGTATVTIDVRSSAPTPTPTPTPTATPAPTATPVATLPLPTRPLPTLPLPLPIATASADPTGPSPSPSPVTRSSASPIASGSPDPAGGGPGAGASPGGPGGSSTTSGSGGTTGAGPGRPDGSRKLDVDVRDGLRSDVGLAEFGVDAAIEWAIPVVALTVPGLLLALSVLAQMLGGAVWLPVARRWLGGFGIRRGRPAADD